MAKKSSFLVQLDHLISLMRQMRKDQGGDLAFLEAELEAELQKVVTRDEAAPLTAAAPPPPLKGSNLESAETPVEVPSQSTSPTTTVLESTPASCPEDLPSVPEESPSEMETKKPNEHEVPDSATKAFEAIQSAMGDALSKAAGTLDAEMQAKLSEKLGNAFKDVMSTASSVNSGPETSEVPVAGIVFNKAFGAYISLSNYSYYKVFWDKQ